MQTKERMPTLVKYLESIHHSRVGFFDKIKTAAQKAAARISDLSRLIGNNGDSTFIGNLGTYNNVMLILPKKMEIGRMEILERWAKYFTQQPKYRGVGGLAT